MLAAVVEGREGSEPAARRDIPGEIGEPLPVVEEGEIVGRLQAEYAAAASGEIGDQIVRGAVADRAGRSGRLVDVLVVEYELRPQVV